eukprot:s2108_g2.t1
MSWPRTAAGCARALIGVLAVTAHCAQASQQEACDEVVTLLQRFRRSPSAEPVSLQDAAARAASLARELTREEIQGLIRGTGYADSVYNPPPGFFVGNTDPVPRKGIPSLNLQDNGQGYRTVQPVQIGQATSFPSTLAVAATWDESLGRAWGEALGKEFLTKGANVLLGPALNVHRVARGGRNVEYLSGESPYLGARLVKGYIEGVHSQNVLTVMKHFITNNQETNRNTVNSIVDDRTLWEVYYPPFVASVEAGCLQAMCSYNLVNGDHACSNPDILLRDLKESMNYQGAVMSDWWALHSFSAAEGLDMEMPGNSIEGNPLNQAYFTPNNTAELSMEKLQDMAARILIGVVRYGLMERPACTPAAGGCHKEIYELVSTSEAHKGVSLAGTVVTMLNVFVGGGSVVLPYAFRLSGWLFVPLLLAVGVLMGFTLWIMGFLLEAVDDQAEQMGVPRSQRDWGFIGYAAFGNIGRLLFAGCMFFDLTGGALVLVSIVIEQLPFLLPFRHNVTAVLSCVLAFGCCLLPKRFFSIMAVLGMSSQVMLILGLVITGVELSSLNEVATDQTALKAAGVPSAFGIALLCFLAHSEAPLIYQMMEDRKQWTKAVIYSMTLTEAFLLTFGALVCQLRGALGYGFFGGSVAQSIADNIGRDLELQVLPGGLNVLLGAITILGLSTKQLVTLPLLLDATTDLFGERLRWKGQLLVKAIILSLSGIVVVLLQDAVAFIGDLVGILPANGVCVIFPCAALLQMYGHEMRTWQRIGVDDVTSTKELATKIVADSVILLKNENDVLPFAEGLQTIALLGSVCNASNDVDAMLATWDLGNYYTVGGSGRVIPDQPSTILEATAAYCAKAGCQVVTELEDDVEAALLVAEKADVALLCSAATAAEGRDRESLSVDQEAYVLAVSAKLSIPKVSVSLIPGSIVMPWAQDVDAAVALFLAGEATGKGLLQVLSGEVNPAAKSPVTFPLSENDAIPPCTEVECEYTEGVWAGFPIYEDKEVSFPFGHGLSYTTFSYELQALSTSCDDAAVESAVCAEVDLINSGPTAGAEVVQLYLGYPTEAKLPQKLLKAFRKAWVPLDQQASHRLVRLLGRPELPLPTGNMSEIP